MNPGDLIDMLTAMGVVLKPNGDKLLIGSPTGVTVPADLRACITENKALIIEMLSGEPESPVRQSWVYRDCNKRLRAMLAADRLGGERWP